MAEENPAREIDVGIAAVVCLTASIIEFATAADECSTTKSCSDSGYVWAIAVGVISTVVCLARLSVLKIMPEFPRVADAIFGGVLVCLWVFGAAFNTRAGGPFTATNNGYFATWIAFLAAAFYFYQSLVAFNDRVRHGAETAKSNAAFVLVASIVELSVAADTCTEDHTCTKEYGWAVAVGVISFFICVAQLVLSRVIPSSADMIIKATSAALVILWAAGAGANTSTHGPFHSSCRSANGYFATWAAFFLSLFGAYRAFVPDNTANYDEI